jgi:hypothetical protein
MAAVDTLASSKNRADPAGAPRIEWVSIGALRPNPRNARTHSRKQIKQIAASIRSVGFLSPVIVDDADMVLFGHGRLEAARLEGLTHAPIIRFGHLTEVQKRAYVIADNKLAEQAVWDREILAIELGELIDLMPAEGFDISLTGFEAPEIDLLLADMAPSRLEAEDILPALPRNPTTRRGDLWRLGKHRLCSTSRIRFRLRRNGPGAVSKSSSLDWRHIGDLIDVRRELYGDMLKLVVWNKSNAGQGSFYRSQHELIGVFRDGGHPHRNNVELGRFGRNRSKRLDLRGRQHLRARSD